MLWYQFFRKGSAQGSGSTYVRQQERIDYWLGVGAQPSGKVAVLIKKYGTNGTHLEEQRAALDRLKIKPAAPTPVAVPLPSEETPAAEEAPAAEAPAEEAPAEEAPAAEAPAEETEEPKSEGAE